MNREEREKVQNGKWIIRTMVKCKDCYSAWHQGEESWCECDQLEGEE